MGESASVARSRARIVAAIVRWVARVAGLASVSLLAMFMIGEPGAHTIPSAEQWFLILFFPWGVVLGIAIGWFRPIAGGVLALGALGCFYAVCLRMTGHVPRGPYFAIFASPGLMMLASGVLDRAVGRGVSRSESGRY